ncbi:hypothetical protein O8J68_31625, partial [Pseudomonas aeruginosa]|uniref:hypothetical protein n=2 Tax=Pseudomonas aeruginosa TaxID=287 RepID=UPI0022B6BC98
SETPEGNLKWLAATSTAGTPDRQAAAKATFSTESADCCQSSLDLREPQALEIAMQLNGERWHIANKIPFPATVVLSLLSAPDLAEKPAP